jgi:hypothetical protein
MVGRVLTGDAKSRLLASAARYNEHIGVDR